MDLQPAHRSLDLAHRPIWVSHAQHDLKQEPQNASIEVFGEEEVAGARERAESGCLVRKTTGDNPLSRLARPLFVQIVAGVLPALIVNIGYYYKASGKAQLSRWFTHVGSVRRVKSRFQ